MDHAIITRDPSHFLPPCPLRSHLPHLAHINPFPLRIKQPMQQIIFEKESTVTLADGLTILYFWFVFFFLLFFFSKLVTYIRFRSGSIARISFPLPFQRRNNKRNFSLNHFFVHHLCVVSQGTFRVTFIYFVRMPSSWSETRR